MPAQQQGTGLQRGDLRLTLKEALDFGVSVEIVRLFDQVTGLQDHALSARADRQQARALSDGGGRAVASDMQHLDARAVRIGAGRQGEPQPGLIEGDEQRRGDPREGQQQGRHQNAGGTGLRHLHDGRIVAHRAPAASIGAESGDGGFERGDEARGHIAAGLLGDFLKAGRAGDVDFGELVANDVDAHQQQTARGQHRPQRAGDGPVGL